MTIPSTVDKPYLFLEAEEIALKAKLADLTVSDKRNAARPVGVWFRAPEREFSQTSFPFIAISFTGLSEETNRAMSYNVEAQNYLPDRVPVDVDNQFFAPYPIPVSLSFTIEVHARDPYHDLQLLRRLLEPDKLPMRFGYLEVPTDGTIRRLDNLGWAQSDFFDGDSKRTLRKLIAIEVSAEMLPQAAWELTQVESVVVEVDTIVTPL